MGRHKNPITLSFLKLLRDRGKLYNFLVEEESPLIKGVYIADLVYKLPTSKQTILSFEVESKPTSYVIKNAVKIFANTSKEVAKPWHHFILILNGKLKPSDKKAVESVTEKHNVHLFENILIDDEQNEKFLSILEKISKGIIQAESNKDIKSEFKIIFSSKLNQCTELIELKESDREINDAIDDLIMLFKDRIEKWDVPSVKYATTELFNELYKYYGQKK